MPPAQHFIRAEKSQENRVNVMRILKMLFAWHWIFPLGLPLTEMKIASFNAQRFGLTKVSDPAVLTSLVKVKHFSLALARQTKEWNGWYELFKWGRVNTSQNMCNAFLLWKFVVNVTHSWVLGNSHYQVWKWKLGSSQVHYQVSKKENRFSFLLLSLSLIQNNPKTTKNKQKQNNNTVCTSFINKAYLL